MSTRRISAEREDVFGKGVRYNSIGIHKVA